MDADDVKRALRQRHPATDSKNGLVMPGPWTVLEEWRGIDLLALCAWKGAAGFGHCKITYPRVGYEVKVSRQDMRQELLNPAKRAEAVESYTNAFYFAVPAEMLKLEEVAWHQPDYDGNDFLREECPDNCLKRGQRRGWMRRAKGKMGHRYNVQTHRYDIPCQTCDGKSYLQKSRVEREAPTLWVPPDCGLVEIREDRSGKHSCHVIKEAPVTEARPLHQWEVHDLLRWTSLRPDERHAGVIEGISEWRKQWR